MNEELKIIIKAVVDEAKNELAKVKKELKEVSQEADKAGKVSDAIKSIGKTAAVAVASVAALATAMTNLGRSAMEAQKTFARLEAGFVSAGSSADQARQTYEGLYRFLGDQGAATEASNLLAQLTTDTEALAEWTTILQGVYAKFPSSIPVESLAEAANETAKTGQITGALADALNWAGVSEEVFQAALNNTSSAAEREALIRSTLNGLYGSAAALYEQNNGATLDYNQSQAQLQGTLAQASYYLTPLLTNLANLASTLLQVLGPALQTISAILIVFIQWIAAAATAIGSFFGGLKGGKSDVNDIATTVGNIGVSAGGASSGIDDMSNSLADATDQAKELKRQTMGFDELNIMSSDKSAANSGGGPDSVEIPEITIPEINIPSIDMSGLGLDDFEAQIEEVRERMEGVLVLAGLVGVALAAWGIIQLIQHFDVLKPKLIELGAKALIIAGALLLVQGYSDAWANGIDWGNLALVLGGIAAVITGITIQFGALAGSIAGLTAGVALLVLGVKDFIQNGPTVQNTILIIGGAIATAVALATMGIGPLIAAIVGLVAAVAAFTVAILLEEPAIMSVADAQNALTEAKNRAKDAENGYINAVDAAEKAMNRLAEAEKAAGMTGAELAAQVQSGAIDYANMTDAQKELYKAYLDNEQKQKDLTASTEEFNAAKKAETMASYEHQLALAKESGDYETFKNSVVAAFEAGEISADEARMLIEKSMSEMSDASQQTFMKDLPGDITNGLDPHKYESTGTKIKKWFGNVWQGIKDVFSKVGDWFKDTFSKAWEKVKEVFSKGGKIFDGIKDGILNGLKTVINGIIGGINKVIEVPFNGLNSALLKIKGRVPQGFPVFCPCGFGRSDGAELRNRAASD